MFSFVYIAYESHQIKRPRIFPKKGWSKLKTCQRRRKKNKFFWHILSIFLSSAAYFLKIKMLKGINIQIKRLKHLIRKKLCSATLTYVFALRALFVIGPCDFAFVVGYYEQPIIKSSCWSWFW